MKLLITINGVAHEVAPKMGDLVRFEREYDIPASALDENTRVEHVMYIAWLAMHRTGDFAGDFEEFLDLADGSGSSPLDLPPPPAS